MAHITLAGVLLDPTGEFSVGDKVKFTHQSTTGSTMKSAVSVLKVPPNGAYNINLEYGLVLVEYNDYRLGQYRNLGIATVNATNTATSIPELLNALVPASSAELIQFQAILADAVTAKTTAEAAATTAQAFAYQLTTTELIASTATFTAATTIPTSGFITSGDGCSGLWKQNGVTGQAVSQTPVQLNSILLNDGNGVQWALVDGQVSNYFNTIFYPNGFGVDGAGTYRLSNGAWNLLTPTVGSTDLFDLNRAPSRKDNHLSAGGNFRWLFDGDRYNKPRGALGSYATWVEDKTIYKDFFEELGATKALYFTKLINPAYTGFCMNITNEVTSAAFDVGFASDGSLDLVLLRSKLKNSTGLINTWYDQSGNGNDATSTGTDRPILSKSALINGLHAVIFEMGTDYNGGNIKRFLTLPAGVTGQSNNVTMGTLAKFRHSIRDCPLIELAGSDGNYTTLGKKNQSGVDSIIVTQNGTRRVTSGHQPNIGTNFVVGSVGTTESYAYLNGADGVSGTTGTGVTFAGGQLGSTTNTYINGDSSTNDGGSAMAGVFIKANDTNVLEYRNIWFPTITENKISSFDSGNLIFDGDSITEGSNGRFYTSYPQIIQKRLSIKPQVFNVAFAGGTTNSQNNNRSKWEAALINTNAPFNVIVLAIGTNDIGGGATDSTIWTNIQAYIAAVKLIGYDVILSTVLPRALFNSDATKEGYRLALNQSMRGGFLAAGCIGIIDYENEGTMGKTSFASNTTYYKDGTHPTSEGLGLMATFVEFSISNILKNKLSIYYSR